MLTCDLYSRISREILDKIWHIFLQFDAGPKFGPLKHNIFRYFCVLGTSKPFNRKIKKSHFGHFFQLIFPIRLIRGSTYTRVFTLSHFEHVTFNLVIKREQVKLEKWFLNYSNIFLCFKENCQESYKWRIEDKKQTITRTTEISCSVIASPERVFFFLLCVLIFNNWKKTENNCQIFKDHHCERNGK